MTSSPSPDSRSPYAPLITDDEAAAIMAAVDRAYEMPVTDATYQWVLTWAFNTRVHAAVLDLGIAGLVNLGIGSDGDIYSNATEEQVTQWTTARPPTS